MVYIMGNERSKEHLNDADKFREGSHIIKHWIAEHPEEDQFIVLQSFKDSISRQLAEALKIHCTKDQNLNSKNAYNSNYLARTLVQERKVTHKRGDQCGRQDEQERIPEGWIRNKRRKLETQSQAQVLGKQKNSA